MGASVGPVKSGERMAALDVLRGVAVCGILLMNIPVMGLPVEQNVPHYPVALNVDWIAFAIQRIGFEGSMRGLFTLLFGAGMVVMLRSAPDDASGPSSPAGQAYLTRCFGLMLLGVAQFALFLWPGEILFNYGVVGLALILFRRARVRLLFTAAAALLMVWTFYNAAGDFGRAETLRTAEAAVAAKNAHKPLTHEQSDAIDARADIIKGFHPPPELLAKEKAQRTSFPGVWIWSLRTWVKFNFEADSSIYLAESLAFMLIGVALLRLRVLTGEQPMRVYAAMAAGGFAVGMGIRIARVMTNWSVGYEPDPDALSWGNLVYEPARLGLTIGYVGLVGLLYKAGALGFIAGALKAMGRLALTNYIGQSIITSALFYGLGLYDKLGFAALMGLCVLIWIVLGSFSVLWLRRWEMGPFEWLLRSLTYGVWQTIGRPKAAAATAPAPAE
jgi:uncharacterized protein